MKIAVIGWGSLIWDPRTLARSGRWHEAGPHLPIEFVRISKDGRLTLAIHPPSKEQRTYWVLSALDTVEAARNDLALREVTTVDNVGSAFRDEVRCGEDAIEVAVRRWLGGHSDLEAAIWTGLPFTLEGPDVVAQAVAYLTSLTLGSAVYDRAREYVTNAPPQIQTAVRREMQDRQWRDVELPADLFAEPRRRSIER